MKHDRFGTFAKQVRETQGLSVAELAQRLSVTSEQVEDWENGQTMPDEDMLCHLADVLEVNVPELEQGQYLYKDGGGSVPVTEPLILPPFSGLTKFRRIVACAIDFMVTSFAGIILLAVAFVGDVQKESSGMILAGIALFIVMIFGFFLRDWLWKGRSFGKRLLGLVVLNNRTGAPPVRWRLAVRTLFFWTSWIDLIVMLACGRSIGDYVAHTIVIPQKAASVWKESLPSVSRETQDADERSTKKWLKRVGIGLLMFLMVTLTAALIGIQVSKTTPKYEAAYTYFVESDTFVQLGVSENRVWMNSYSLYMDGGQQTAKITFVVGFKQYSIICHKQMEDDWMVCKKCTAVI